jgi:glutathione peroxidase
MFEKVDVNGDSACELYKRLTSLDTKPKGAGKIGWNFEKFVIDRSGFVVGRFGSRVKPDAPEIIELVERELAKEPTMTR